MGIRGQEEQEKRATTSLRAVPEFGQALVGPLGAPKGRIATYAEIQLKDAAGLWAWSGWRCWSSPSSCPRANRPV